ncbi:hypothetical protein [Amycolatopsis sp.]|jgi:hypothetical protein|nr:hypothetical protein [Amycolatopsis sp.]
MTEYLDPYEIFSDNEGDLEILFGAAATDDMSRAEPEQEAA